MIDIHAHILPALDDGPPDDQSALRMAYQAINDGISTTIATPHVGDGRELDGGVIGSKVNRFKDLLKQHRIALDVLPGAEITWDGAGLPPITVLNGGPYLLIEFPHAYIPSNAEEGLLSIRNQGYFPIIAHPERNAAVIQDPNALLHILAPDILVQITAASLVGSMGSSAQQCAMHLLRKGAVHFLATDCHSPTNRKPELSLARNIAAKIIGEQNADRLVNEHPLAVVRGTRFN